MKKRGKGKNLEGANKTESFELMRERHSEKSTQQLKRIQIDDGFQK